jgi:hypothetical protein
MPFMSTFIIGQVWLGAQNGFLVNVMAVFKTQSLVDSIVLGRNL